MVAERLHAALETYRAPKSLRSTNLSGPGLRLKRVFLDREEMRASSSLRKSLLDALGQSRFLIVICSPRAHQSHWVNEEISAFSNIHGSSQILALLIEGMPESSIPPALSTNIHGLSDYSMPLAADIRAGSPRQSLRMLKYEKLRLLAPILGVSFDDLRQREHQRAIRRRTALIASLSAACIVLASLTTAAVLASRRAQRNYNTALEAGKMTLPLLALEQADLVRREIYLKNAVETVEKLCREDPASANCLELLRGLKGVLVDVQISLGKPEKANKTFDDAKGLDVPLAIKRLQNWEPKAKPANDDLFSELPDTSTINHLRELLNIWERPRAAPPSVEEATIYAEYASQYVLVLDIKSQSDRAEAARVLRNAITKFRSVGNPHNKTEQHEQLLHVLDQALGRLNQ
ncbi:MAG TPA: toll/interleukin-1 receptor domain-containing protein [Candidatus Angelobacter sp.]|nr:toll/interleukin-1 receptor domain-containing protein [Candidatus Angelobacter sp.]